MCTKEWKESNKGALISSASSLQGCQPTALEAQIACIMSNHGHRNSSSQLLWFPISIFAVLVDQHRRRDTGLRSLPRAYLHGVERSKFCRPTKNFAVQVRRQRVKPLRFLPQDVQVRIIHGCQGWCVATLPRIECRIRFCGDSLNALWKFDSRNNSHCT